MSAKLPTAVLISSTLLPITAGQTGCSRQEEGQNFRHSETDPAYRLSDAEEKRATEIWDTVSTKTRRLNDLTRQIFPRDPATQQEIDQLQADLEAIDGDPSNQKILSVKVYIRDMIEASMQRLKTDGSIRENLQDGVVPQLEKRPTGPLV